MSDRGPGCTCPCHTKDGYECYECCRPQVLLDALDEAEKALELAAEDGGSVFEDCFCDTVRNYVCPACAVAAALSRIREAKEGT